MGSKTGIEWTDATWNPIRGCSRVSPGCVNCYAERVAARFSGPGLPYEGLATNTPSGPRWTGEVRLVPEALDLPLRWRHPRRVFVNSMSDLFHEKLSNDEILCVFGAMAAAPRHTFQVLTKRAARMREWFAWAAEQIRGLSRFTAWARSVREQCSSAGVAFFFKQWGEWAPRERDDGAPFDSLDTDRHALVDVRGLPNATRESAGEGYAPMSRFGKKRAGSLLDGAEHKAFPVSWSGARHG